jgi:hypothetical protein
MSHTAVLAQSKGGTYSTWVQTKAPVSLVIMTMSAQVAMFFEVRRIIIGMYGGAVMREIPLHGKYGSGKTVKVDDEDYERLASRKWHVDNCGYVRCHELKSVNPARPVILMHRLIMHDKLAKGLMIDHINGDKFDNRKQNLRTCSNQQNMCNRNKPNRKIKGAKASIYKGVRGYGRNGKWEARISINGKAKHIGVYETEKEAALAYNVEALRLQGQFAKLNVI